MKSLNCTPQSFPVLPDTSNHPLWQCWDLCVEAVVSNVVGLQKGHDQFGLRPLSMASTFFAEQLTAFEIWLDFHSSSVSGAAVGEGDGETPMHLPIVLQVLLSNTHRVRALLLLRRYLALGPAAVNNTLLVGIFPYVLKLLYCPAADIKQILMHVWASILGFDPSGRVEIVREKLQGYFIKNLASPDMGNAQRCMCAFVLAQICNGYREGQEACLQQGLHRTCCALLSQAESHQNSPALRKWVALCLAKLCEGFGWAKYLSLTEAGHTQLYPLLVDPDPGIRAAAVLALGEFFGASALGLGPATASSIGGRAQTSGSTSHSVLELRQVELQLAVQILESCLDSCVLVRLEAVIALNRFFHLSAHSPCLKLVVSALLNQEHRMWASSKGNGSSTKGYRIPFPWMLTPTNAHSVVRQVRQLIESQGTSGASAASPLPRDLLSPPFSPVDDQQQPQLDLSLGYGPTPLTGVSSTAAAMAPAYVRLWLALKEVQHRDPHALVETAASVALSRLESTVVEEQRKRGDSRLSDTDAAPNGVSSKNTGSFDYSAADGRRESNLSTTGAASTSFQFPGLGSDVRNRLLCCVVHSYGVLFTTVK